MNIVRIKLNVDLYTEDAISVISGSTPKAWAGTSTEFQIGLFKGKSGEERLMTAEELADFVSATFGIFAESRTGNPFSELTLAAEDFDATVTDETWDDGTKQHLSFAFSAVEMELPVDANRTTKNYWWVITANAEEATLGGGILEVVRDRDATDGPRQAGNLIPAGAVYGAGGTYVLNGLTVGKVYKWVTGSSGFDSYLMNGAELVSESNQNFIAQATSVTLYGEEPKPVGAVVWSGVFLTAEESDARYVRIGSGGDGGTISVNFIIDGGGSAIVAGTKGFVEIPFAMTITGWTLLADVAGSIEIDVLKSDYAGFAAPASIAGTELPTLTAATQSKHTALTGWTLNVNAGDILRFNVNSAATVKLVTLSITGSKS